MNTAMAKSARSARLMTVEEFMQHDFPEGKVELVRGEPRVTPLPGAPHSLVCARLVERLMLYTAGRGLGQVFTDGTGYHLLALPRTVRGPDVSFVRAEHLPSGGIGPGLLRLAPDLAVEVLSPSDTASGLDEKLDDYRAAGTPLIWVIDPSLRTVMVISGDAPVRWLRAEDELDGGDVVSGFRCRVVELFEGLAV